uniref:Uncharacterized protein n=1 Tax=Brassica oleracea var. oleracea TaxID=109376 RepID=A0A0D3DME6_BRAOL
MTLYTVLRQEIGLKSVVNEALVFFGIRTRFAEFHCFKSFPDVKNSKTASVTSGPTTDHEAMKNSVE